MVQIRLDLDSFVMSAQPAAMADNIDAVSQALDQERSARVQAELALAEAQTGVETLDAQCQELQSLLEAALAVDRERLWVWDGENDQLTIHSPAHDEEAGSDEVLRLRDMLEDAFRDDQPALRAAWRDLLNGTCHQIDISFRRAEEMAWRWNRIRGLALKRDARGTATRVVGTIKDVTDQRLLDERRALRGLAFVQGRDGTVLLTENLELIESNIAFQALAGGDDTACKGKFIDRFFPGLRSNARTIQKQRYWQGETEMRALNGGLLTIDMLIAAANAGPGMPANTMIATVRDITDEKKRATTLDRMARFDAVTELPNRLSFQAELDYRLAARSDEPFALLFIDIAGFKQINDALGHEAGDELLREIASRLAVSSGQQAYLARWGGDEFILLAAHRDARAEALRIADRIVHQLQREFSIGVHRVSANAHIGISLAPIDGTNASVLLRRADTALSVARRSGHERWEFFKTAFDEDAVKRVTLVNLLRQDADRGRFVFVAQPKVDGQQRAVGFELLVRWFTESFGAVSPAFFVPLAEEIGVIGQLGRDAMLAATRLIRALRERGCPIPVAVNLSSKQMFDPSLEQALLEACEIEDIPTSLLEVEVTESSLLENMTEATALLSRLRRNGFTVSLDDFGTGYSSLSYLRDLPFDKVKIDRSFVISLQDGPKPAALTRGIVNLCKALGLKTVAEGVETRDQFDALQSMGVNEYQGYLFSKPLEFDRALAFAEGKR